MNRTIRKSSLSLAIAALLPCALSAADFVSTGTVRYVDNQLGSDETGDGTEEHPYASINKAVSLMAKEDIVRIRPGKVYVLDAPITNDYAAFHVNNAQNAHITIEGTDPDNRVVISGDGRHQGFALYGMGTLMRNLCISNCTVEATGQGAAVHFLDGTGWSGLAEMWRLGARFDNCAFVACTNTTADTDNSQTPGVIWVNKCAFYDCEFIANQGAGCGGAVYCKVQGNSNGGKCFSNCVFRANSAWDYGGALYTETTGTTSIFGNCLFESNSVRKSVHDGDCTGGALFGVYSDIGGCTFRGNYAYGGGGAIYARGQSPVIHDCVFENNSSYGDNWYPGGGAIYCWSGGRISDCTFTSNSMAKSNGGALFVAAEKAGQPISVSGCVFDGNSANGSGGAIFVKNGSTSITGVFDRVTYTGNTATGTGGAFYSEAGDKRLIVVRNSLFAKNSAKNGGGAASHYWGGAFSATSLENCTFANNSATDKGGGFYVNSSICGVTNCIFYGNMLGATTNAIQVTSSATVETGNCMEESANPLFRAPAKGDYSLKKDSTARNAGVILPWMADAFDLAGNERVNPDDLVGGVARPDLGCYEWYAMGGGTLMLLR